MLAHRYRGGTMHGPARSEHGAVAVEFALVLPILVMLMFGVFTAAQAYSDHLSITNAVRESARFGAAIDHSSSATGWGNSVRSRVEQVYMNGMGSLSSDQICVLLEDSAGGTVASASPQGSCGAVPASPSSMSAGSCVVKVWVRKPAEISLMVAPVMSFNIGAQSVALYGRETVDCEFE